MSLLAQPVVGSLDWTLVPCTHSCIDMDGEEIVNVNVGVLGHVDSGKTSFCGAVSSVLSTAALDKSPQSQARGITQDLQFSAFRVPKCQDEGTVGEQATSSEKSSSATSGRKVVFNFTLVDCPGHASLIRTIIGGSFVLIGFSDPYFSVAKVADFLSFLMLALCVSNWCVFQVLV